MFVLCVTLLLCMVLLLLERRCRNIEHCVIIEHVLTVTYFGKLYCYVTFEYNLNYKFTNVLFYYI